MRVAIYCEYLSIGLEYAKKVLGIKKRKKISLKDNLIKLEKNEPQIFYPIDFEYLGVRKKAKQYYYLLSTLQTNICFLTDNYSAFLTLSKSFLNREILSVISKGRLKVQKFLGAQEYISYYTF